MKIIIIGGSGLVGSRIAELLEKKFTISLLGRSSGVDITLPDTLIPIERDTESEVVLHIAAKADVDGCEQDRPLGKEGDAWKINVEGAGNVAKACKKSGKKMIYISTDFVFSGDDTPEGGYTEEDTPHPVNWYAKTKYEGELDVQQEGIPFIIARSAYPYRAKFDLKKDFARAILSRLQNGQEVSAVTDHYFNPTFIDDIASSLETLITKDQTGIFHVVGSETLTPYEAATKIAETFSLDKALVKKTTREEYFKNKAPRPYNLTLKNAKITGLGVTMHSFSEGLQIIKEQL